MSNTVEEESVQTVSSDLNLTSLAVRGGPGAHAREVMGYSYAGCHAVSAYQVYSFHSSLVHPQASEKSSAKVYSDLTRSWSDWANAIDRRC